MRFSAEDWGHSVYVEFPDGRIDECKSVISNGEEDAHDHQPPSLVSVEMSDGRTLLSGSVLDGSWGQSEIDADEFLRANNARLIWNGSVVNIFERR